MPEQQNTQLQAQATPVSTTSIGSAVQAYESQIWSTADTLYSNGFKASVWPSLMMPFFALILVESRIVREMNEKIKELETELETTFDRTSEYHVELLNETVFAQNYGYHPELVKHNRTLATLCETQPSNFMARLMEYLAGYDQETKTLLGIDYAEGTSKHLDLKGTIGALNAKSHGVIDVLYTFTKKWAQIDLSIFNNSEVTTIEEHIKHKWADISAETAGEHYTPFDVIELCTDINVAIAPIDPEGSWEVYDMTCGGGNFVFGLEDSLRKMYPNLSVHSFGQEYNDQLYALGAIEARFRPSAQIKYGNTLTNDRFTGQQFGSVIGNPPYGTEWKDFADSVKKDKTGRFSADKMPPVSDSQMLFLQHAVSHMKDNGVGTIVHNGSPLTSGDAEGGESNIRRHLLKDLDVVQAIIQLPQNIFFNTGISTYIWVLNKAKPSNLKGKVMLINAESLFTKLKKSLNKKSCVIGENDRKAIVKLLIDAVDTDICKVVNVDAVMYNKVELQITRQDENGLSVKGVEKTDKAGKVSFVPQKLEAVSGIAFRGGVNDRVVNVLDGVAIGYSIEQLKELTDAANQIIVMFKRTAQDFDADSIAYDTENQILTWFNSGKSLGKGVLSVKASKIKPKKGEEVKLGEASVADHSCAVELAIGPLLEKDSEIIEYSYNSEKNKELIDAFLAKWVKEPFTILDTKVGCEINFNKVFPKKIKIRKSTDILAELNALIAELGEI